MRSPLSPGAQAPRSEAKRVHVRTAGGTRAHEMTTTGAGFRPAPVASGRAYFSQIFSFQ
jgi:hypothetical protein